MGQPLAAPTVDPDPPPVVTEDDFAKARQEAYQALLEGLEELAGWCTKKKLFLERQGIWELIIEVDPDHAEARRGLGFRRNKEGAWEDSGKKRRPPKNFGKEHLDDFALRRQETLAPFGDMMLGMLDVFGDALTPADVKGVYDDVLRFDPDHVGVRKRLNQVKLEDRWVLRETAVARGRRAELRALAKDVRAAAPRAKAVEPNDKEKGFGLSFRAILGTPLVRALGTGNREEVERACTALHAARDFVNTLFETEANYDARCTAYLLQPGDKAAFLDNHPAIFDRYRKFLDGLDGSGIDGTGDFAHWGADEAQRLDGIVRNAVGWLLEDAFGITVREAWVYEGFGLYLTRSLIGTRLSWFVQNSSMLSASEEAALRARLLNPETNWMDEAHRMLQKDGRPTLATVFARKINTLTPEDLLFAYVTTAYVLEARADRAGELLRRLGRREKPEDAIQAALDMSVPELDERVRTWLSERR